MRTHRGLIPLAVLLAIGCNKSSTGTTPQITYSLQVKTNPPATATAGATVAVAVTVMQTQSGNSTAAGGQTVTFTVTAGGGSIGGATSTTVQSAADGSAGTSWQLGNTAGTQTLRASISTTNYTDFTVTATALPASQLTITTQPSATVVVGAALAQQPVIQLRDANSGLVSQAGVVVTAAVASGGATLGGTTTATTNASGVATFTNLSLTSIGTATLGFSAPLNGTTATVTSQTIVISPLPPTQITITTQPSATVLSAVALAVQPVLQLRDVNNAAVAQSGVVVTATVATGSAALGGTATATTNGSGVAAFTNLSLSSAGSATLKFTATLNGQSVNVTSQTITVTNQLGTITAESVSAQSGIPLFVQPVLQLQDGLGNAVHQAGVSVTASAATGGSTLSVATGGVGSLTVATDANGQVAFHDLTLTGSGASTIQFAASNVATLTAPAVTVAASGALLIISRIAAGPFNAAAGTQSYYTFTVPAGTTSIDFSTYGATSNVDFYARPGTYPTAADFACHSNVSGPAQVCSITSNLSATWYLAVNAPAGYTGSNVVAYAYTPNCTPQPLTIGVQASGTVNSTSCTADVAAEDRYTMTIATTQLITFTTTASGPNQLLVYRQGTLRGGVFVSGAPYGNTSVNLMGPGTYNISILDPTQGGVVVAMPYTILATSTPSEPTACKLMILPGASATINLTLRNTDCTGTTAGTFSQRINVLLGAGQTLTATMASTAFDPFLKIETPAQTINTGLTVLASDDNSGGGTTARVSYTNPSTLGDGVGIMVEATSTAAGGLGLYTITLTITPDFPDVAAPVFRLQPGAPTVKQPNW